MDSGEQLPKIVDALQFPILEEIPAIKPTEKDTPKPQVKRGFSVAKKRFNQMAFSVLAQIIDEKQKGTDEEDEDDKVEEKIKSEEQLEKESIVSNQEVTKGKTKSTPRGGSNSITPRKASVGERSLSRQGSASSLATVDSTATTKGSTTKKKSKKGPSFMSVIRLANYRRKAGVKGFLGRKGATSVASSLGDLDEDDENIKELPREPRFCATLSTEAQYAMLKCYEDVLLENIRTTKSKEPVPDDATLFRVKTPSGETLRSLRLAGGGSVGANKDSKFTLPLLNSQMEDSVDGTKPSSRESDCRVSVSSSIHLPSIPNKRPSSNSSSIAPLLQGKFHIVPKDKQLRLSYRFQTAMDILDAVREIKGQVVTTPRAPKLADINPMRNYNQWSKGWSKEFQYELKDTQGNMKT